MTAINSGVFAIFYHSNFSAFYHSNLHTTVRVSEVPLQFLYELVGFVNNYRAQLAGSNEGSICTIRGQLVLPPLRCKTPPFFNFYIKTCSDDAAILGKLRSAGYVSEPRSVLQCTRSISQKYNWSISNLSNSRRVTSGTCVATTKRSVYFSTRFTNLFFLKCQQQLIRLFTYGLLRKNNNIYYYINSKLKNTKYAEAYLLYSPLRTFFTFKHSSYNQEYAYKNSIPACITLLYGSAGDAAFMSSQHDYSDGAHSNYRTPSIKKLHSLHTKLASIGVNLRWPTYSISSGSTAHKGKYLYVGDTRYPRYISGLEVSNYKAVQLGCGSKKMQQLYTKKKTKGTVSVADLWNSRHTILGGSKNRRFSSISAELFCLAQRGTLQRSTSNLFNINFLIFRKTRYIFSRTHGVYAQLGQCATSCTTNRRVAVFGGMLHNYMNKWLFNLLCAATRVYSFMRKYARHISSVRSAKLSRLQSSLVFAALTEYNHIRSRAHLRRSVSRAFSAFATRNRSITVYSRLLYNILNPTLFNFFEFKSFFYQKSYSSLYDSLLDSSTLFYYYTMHNTLNQNIFKYSMDILRDLAQPFYFTTQHSELSTAARADAALINAQSNQDPVPSDRNFFLANLATGFEYIVRKPIRLVKLQGHYLPMWRQLRQSFRETRCLRNILRQHRLTKYIARLGRDVRFYQLQLTELMLFFVLVRSKFILLKHLAILYIQMGYVFINGYQCTKHSFNIQGGDIVQVVYSYESFFYNDLLQRTYLKNIIQGIFYFTRPGERDRDQQAKRIAHENVMRREHLRWLRDKVGNPVDTRFSLLGEYVRLSNKDSVWSSLERLQTSYYRFVQRETRQVQTFKNRVLALKSAATFFRNDRRVAVENTKHPHNVQLRGIDPKHRIMNFFRFNTQKILDIPLFVSDIPPYMEVDYISLSVVLLYTPTSISEMHKTTIFFSGYGLGKMLNWKYAN